LHFFFALTLESEPLCVDGWMSITSVRGFIHSL